MAAPTKITQAHLYTVGNTQYDLRKIVYWTYPVDGAGNGNDTVMAWFGGVQDNKPVIFSGAAAFNTAKTASLGATGG